MKWPSLTYLLAAGLFLAAASAEAQGAHPLRIGVAKVDITPKDLDGIIGMRSYQGVHDHLFARALVFDNGANSAAIVALDLVEMGDTTALRQRIAAATGVAADHIIINASHDHSAPRGGPPTPGTSSATGRPYSTPAYVAQVDDSILDAMRQAKAALQPARFAYGTGKVDVSVQRYGYTIERGWGENPNEEGYSDKTVWVIEFQTPEGAPIAFLFNYAVHSNSMAGEPMIHGDIAGNAEKFVEHTYGDKAIALWSMGAAADQYPKYNSDMGALTADGSHYAPVEIMGSMVGGEVVKVARRLTNFSSDVNIFASARAIPCEMNLNMGRGPNGGPGRGPGGGGPGGPPGGGVGSNGASGNQGGGQGGAGGLGGGPPQTPVRQLLPPVKQGDSSISSSASSG